MRAELAISVWKTRFSNEEKITIKTKTDFFVCLDIVFVPRVNHKTANVKNATVFMNLIDKKYAEIDANIKMIARPLKSFPVFFLISFE